jgi:hypothetical protein
VRPLIVSVGCASEAVAQPQREAAIRATSPRMFLAGRYFLTSLFGRLPGAYSEAPG